MSDSFDPQRPESSPSDSQPQRVCALPRWRLLLHDDEVHDRPYMIDTLMRHTPLSQAAATRRVIQAHERGTALLLQTHRELAELYYVQLSKRNLIVSIEQADA